MDIIEAENKLAEIAGGNYRSLAYKKSYHKEEIETECSIYIHGDTIYSGHTWDDAFKAREIANNKKIEELPIEEAAGRG